MCDAHEPLKTPVSSIRWWMIEFINHIYSDSWNFYYVHTNILIKWTKQKVNPGLVIWYASMYVDFVCCVFVVACIFGVLWCGMVLCGGMCHQCPIEKDMTLMWAKWHKLSAAYYSYYERGL